tara:strand:- start:38 stop:472 length:435 start_codon:yes stop_codon:yes gene_type:complete
MNINLKTIQEASSDKTTPTLASVQKQAGRNFISGMLKAWIIYLNDILNLKRPMTENQIVLATGLILQEYYSLRFADLTVLFRNIITGKHGSFYESLTIDKLMKLFEEYWEERCELSASSKNSKHIEFNQSLNELGTDRKSKRRL